MEHGYRFVIVVTITSEAVAIALLTMYCSIRARSDAHGRRAAPTRKRSADGPAGDPINQRHVAPGAEG